MIIKKSFKNKYYYKLKGELIKKQNELNRRFNLDCATKYKLYENGVLYAYDKYKVLMKSSYHIMGTYNTKTCIFRWGWSNPNYNSKITHFSKNIMKLEDYKNIINLNSLKIKGRKELFEMLVLLSNMSPKIDGYLIYKKPFSNINIYLLLYNCKNTKLSLKKLENNNIKNKKTRKKKKDC